jgi:uncharacterized protein
MKRLIAFAFAFLAAFAPVQAEDAAPQASAHPALWRVTGGKGSAVLLGSLHILPGNANWQSPEIRKAVADADTFVFEIPIDAGIAIKMAELITARGSLPQGQTLQAMLPKDSQGDLDKALAYLSVPAEAVSGKRPWLAGLMLDMALLRKAGQTTPGPDFVLLAQAKNDGKDIRYLETVEQQLALIAPEDPAVELQYFEASLKSYDDAEAELKAMTEAGTKGDAAALGSILTRDFADFPAAKALFFTDRNRAWVEKISAMLAEGRHLLVTVGAGHLAGEEGVPALLRAKGFAVEGP